MPTIEQMRAEVDMLSVGTIPLHPGSMEFADSNAKIILFVRDGEDGRSLFLSTELYGQLSRMYEVRYEDWAGVVTKMLAQVELHNSEDPFLALLNGEVNDGSN